MTKARSTPKWKESVDAFEADLRTRGRAERTVGAYLGNVRAFEAYYRDVLKKSGPFISRLHETDFQSFIDYLRFERGLSVASINAAVSGLSSFVRFALASRWIRRDLTAELSTYRAELPEAPEPLTARMVQRLVTSVDLNGRNGLRDLAILQLLLEAGLRVSEVAALAVRDVTLNKTNGRVHVLSNKSYAERTIPLNLSARRAVKAYMASRGTADPQSPLFLSERGNQVSVGTVQHLTKKYLVMADRGDLSAHDLRHHFAARLYAKTGKLTAVQHALGHRSIVTTARYARVTGKELAEAVEHLDEPASED